MTTETDDNLGSFSFSIEPGPVSISVDGFHFNEITGSLANGRLTLRAIYEVQDTVSQRAHVNLLTHLIHLRVETLVQSGSSIADAVQTAQTELTAQLSPVFGAFSPDNFANYSVYASDSTSSDGAAYILAVSAALYQFAINRGGTGGFDAELALIVNNLSDDFADGVINLQWILDGIDAGALQIDPARLSANLLAHAASVGFTAEPADASLFIDTDRDGIMNALDDDDDNDGLPDDVDPAPLTPANKPPVITGELPRFVVAGLWYEHYLEATDPDGDALTVDAEGAGSYMGAWGVSISPPGSEPHTILPSPPMAGHVIIVGGYAERPPGVYPIKITVSDGTDSAVYETELEVIAAADAPVLQTHPPTVGFRGEAYSATLETTNPQGADLTWSLRNGPEWLSIDPATGELSGTIPQDHRSVLEPFPYPGFTMDLQVQYCRAKIWVTYFDSCPMDTFGVAIDDGRSETVWPVHIDLFDTGEAQGPVVDANPFSETLADAVFTDSLDFVYVVGSAGGAVDGNIRFGLDDVFVKKLDDRQVEQWTRMMGSDGIDRVVSSVMDANEDIYLYIYSNGDWRSLVGDASSPTGNKRIIVKVANDGELAWAVDLANSTDVFVEALPMEMNAPHLATRPGGGVRVFVYGQLLDVDSLGNVSTHASASLGWDVWHIAVADDGSTILTGTSNLARLDADGAELWTVELNADPQMDWYGRSIALDGNGDIIVSGDGSRSDNNGRGWFLARYTADGAQTWFDGYTTNDDQKFQDIGPNGLTTDGSGNIVVAGRLWLESFTTDPYGGDYDTVSKFDGDGNLLWYQKFWRVDGYKYMSVTSTSADELVVVGSGTTSTRIDYPNQFECSEQEPCERYLRDATNSLGVVRSEGGGHRYYLVNLDAGGAEK
ncbi:MAG: hypothetical protein HKN84_07090 [Gammaproteobacteria bacterium]|nr:hypothetical protein [Gammaproteobacteria bacterium]